MQGKIKHLNFAYVFKNLLISYIYMCDYEKSNQIVEVMYNRLSSKEYNTLLADKNRCKAGQDLLNYLCDKYKINRIPLVVSNSKRKCTKRGQTYGFYRFINGKGDRIVIYNQTAKTGQIIAIKVFINTLLHEFVHHYDLSYLHIQPAHTTGFYKRIADLKQKLEN